MNAPKVALFVYFFAMMAANARRWYKTQLKTDAKRIGGTDERAQFLAQFAIVAVALLMVIPTTALWVWLLVIA